MTAECRSIPIASDVRSALNQVEVVSWMLFEQDMKASLDTLMALDPYNQQGDMAVS